ncbi:hypothetical protein [Sporisorium scitamineum]|uniref:Uncharacterized protein n=1 Tax=Sporisorium scitamineum TaxID=49012 RepID=A0A0F7S979_9BASI|nr:hypothetical protein [Sporisorium scitamineum]
MLGSAQLLGEIHNKRSRSALTTDYWSIIEFSSHFLYQELIVGTENIHSVHTS